jgi:hypothetical protein
MICPVDVFTGRLRSEIEQQFTERNKNLQLMEMRTQGNPLPLTCLGRLVYASRLFVSCRSIIEETRRAAEERLQVEQSRTELSTLRKEFSQADVSDQCETMSCRLLVLFISRPFIGYNAT